MPSVLEAVDVCLDAGAPGITVHPRADRRHITPDDVRDDRAGAARATRRTSSTTSKAIRGRSCSTLVDEVRPDQCTLVPVVPGEITSQAGWQPGPRPSGLPDVIARLASRAASASACSSMPTPEPIRWAASVGADRVELYTEPFARAFEHGPDRARASFAQYAERRGSRTRSASASTPATTSTSTTSCSSASCRSSTRCRSATRSCRAALFVGLSTVVREYLRRARGASGAGL